jgi:light-regulated signal transduction histidine kinase (bacteriophytochrome)
MNPPASIEDLDGCNLEPIHIPDAIQPHGALAGVANRAGKR